MPSRPAAHATRTGIFALSTFIASSPCANFDGTFVECVPQSKPRVAKLGSRRTVTDLNWDLQTRLGRFVDAVARPARLEFSASKLASVAMRQQPQRPQRGSI
jgi:hypothetical protein